MSKKNKNKFSIKETSRNFKFKVEKDKYIWENMMFKIVFSNPSIQGFDEESLLKDSSGIMYYYYSVKIYRSIYDDWNEETDEEIYRWKKVISRETYDFPCIRQLQLILNNIIDLDVRINGEKHEYSSGKIRYSKHFSTEGFGCDDFYEITKYLDNTGKNDGYIVYAGCTTDVQGTLESAGIRIPYVNKEDILELKKCVDSFIDYSIEIHNNMIMERN